jgi:hypothetical protein
MFRMESHLAFVPDWTRDPPVDSPPWVGQEIPSEKGETKTRFFPVRW